MDLLSKLKQNPNNPRFIKKVDFEKLKKSIKELSKMLDIRPLAYDSSNDYIILGGNQRLMALQALAQKGFQIKDNWFVDVADWTEEEKKQFIIKDNIAYGSWDWDKLANEWDKEQLEEWGMDMSHWEDPNELNDDYSQKIGEVIYEPKETDHKPADLFQRETKFDAEIEKVQNEEIKEMLKARTAFFHTFDFAKIADYYAYQASPEVQKLFEKLGLVLLDRDKLIEHGFSKIIDETKGEDTFNENQ